MGQCYLEDSKNGIYYTFEIDPDSITWSYKLNTQTYDTFGGRVQQVLGKFIDGLSITGNTGTRGAQVLLELGEIIGQHQTAARVSGTPIRFVVPGWDVLDNSGNKIESYKGWDFNVFIKTFPAIIDVNKSNYTFTLAMEVVVNNQDPTISEVSPDTGDYTIVQSWVVTPNEANASDAWRQISFDSTGSWVFGQIIAKYNGPPKTIKEGDTVLIPSISYLLQEKARQDRAPGSADSSTKNGSVGD